MTELLRTRCVCGWEATGTEDEVVEQTLDHGLRVHNMAGTREQVLERAERIEDDAATTPAAPPASPDDLVVVDAPDRHRFEARLGSTLVGFTQYTIRLGVINILHTEIDPGYEGQGYGSRLATAVLAEARSRGLRPIVRCPFISAYVRRHRAEYPDVDLETAEASAT
jgi:predicted GNAT family acetyltransferase/predicted small metal-binding protein